MVGHRKIKKEGLDFFKTFIYTSFLIWQSQYHRGQKSDRFTVRGQTYDVDQECACQHFKSDL